MSDRLFFILMATLAVAMTGFAAVWPQGLGARSPWPIGHTPVQQTPAMQAEMAREAAQTRAGHETHTEAAAAQLRRVEPVTGPPAPPSATKPATPKGGDPAGLRPDL